MKYIFYEVVLPLLLVLLVYFPGGVTLLRTEAHLFEKVFSTGDLLGIGVLILINSYVELDKTERDLGIDAYGAWKAFIVLAGVFVFVAYLFIKVGALHINLDSDPVAPYITNCAWGSMICLACAALIGALARFLAAKRRKANDERIGYSARPLKAPMSSTYMRGHQ